MWTRTLTRTAAVALVVASSAAACAVGTASIGDTTGLDPGADAQAGVDSGGRDAGTPRDSSTPPQPDTSAPIDANTPADAATDSNQGLPETGLPDTNGIDTGSTCAAHGYTGALVTFNLAARNGDETSVPATTSAAGVSGGALARSAAILPVAGSGSINGSNWGSGATADPLRYYTFGVTPGPGCTVTLSSLTIDTAASTAGPKTADIATSADMFATHTSSFSGTSSTTKPLTASASGPLEVRVYGYGATGTGGTLRIQTTMTLSGSIN